MEVDIEATTVLGWLLFYGGGYCDSFYGCCFMEMDIEATTDSFKMVAVLWRWILKRQPIAVLGWLR